MALVTANRFNTLRQQIDNVLGNGSGDTGYGQTLITQSVQVGDLINATNINNAYEDLRKAYKHQTGGNPASNLIQIVSQGDLIKENDGVNYTGWDQYEALATTIGTNRLTVDSTQQSVVLASSNERGSWNGTITLIINVNFASEDARRNYFNAGGYIQVSSSTTDSSSKGNSWNSVMGGNLKFSAHGTTHTGNGSVTGSGIGNYELDGTSQRLLSNFDAGGGAYSTNDYYVDVQRTSNTQIRFTMNWRDQAGGNPDENISNLRSYIYTATAITDVIGTAPGVVRGSGDNF
tara:strand:- start:834 stop:1703 length:870 start_codon:yes stop_codon:yes gene_type:complete